MRSRQSRRLRSLNSISRLVHVEYERNVAFTRIKECPQVRKITFETCKGCSCNYSVSVQAAWLMLW